MENHAHRAIAIVGLGAVLPDAPNVPAFWKNVKDGRYSISEVQPDRWDPALYYDPDPTAPDKTYSKIGGWVRDYPWEPMKWHLAVPPRVADAMDIAQKWAIACTREALEDFGYPARPLDLNRTAVILGNAMAGEKHYLTALRIYFPEYARELAASPSFAALPEQVRRDITREMHERMGKHLPEITEDCMPGELANCIAGRIANIFNLHGPNYVADAACASAMAAITSAAEGLIENDYDAAITGGIDRNMGASTYVKFCKIGALSATGSRPFAEGADGFVMGEGAAILLLKRLADAERDGDKIYAVLRGIGAASDGKGKGITAPNPLGQKLAVERGWQNAALSPETATYIEGHGTSTRVGDVVEVQSLLEVLGQYHLRRGSMALGSVKSNLGHLKGAAGAAGLLKTVLALHEKVLPPSIHCEHPSPDIDFEHSPVYVNTELKPWTIPPDSVRRAGTSAFGFGGTNFHAVLEEYIPHRITGNGRRSVAVEDLPHAATPDTSMQASGEFSVSPAISSGKAPLRGALVIGGASAATLAEHLRSILRHAEAGQAPTTAAPLAEDLKAPERLAIDFAAPGELKEKVALALKALATDQPAVWKALRAQGIFRGRGPAAKVAFLYTGQGSQYVNMLALLRSSEPLVAETFTEADRVMTPLLGKPLTEYIFVNPADENAVARAEEDLRQTAITQPAVLACDIALTRLLAAYGIRPDFTMGHSLGEYGALVAAGGLPFAEALEAVSARGQEMTRVSLGDNGRMAAVFAPMDEVERLLKQVDGYVVIANVNSDHQAVIGGASKAVGQAIEEFQKAGYEPVALPVSHAFHTSIVAPASGPLRQTLQRLHLSPPRVPTVANVNGEFYPTGSDAVAQMLDILSRQVASPVQFIKGLRTLYNAGARVFVEVGPKKALQGFAEDVLGGRNDIVPLFTNHPKFGDIPSFNQALCGLYAAGLGFGRVAGASEPKTRQQALDVSSPANSSTAMPVRAHATQSNQETTPSLADDQYRELGHIFADVLERGWRVYRGESEGPDTEPVAITGAALGLPGTDHIFDDANVDRILRGDQFIDTIPTRFRRAMLDKHITRLVKSENGGPTFEEIHDIADVIKLAGRGGALDLENEFGVASDRIAALDRATCLAIAVGIDALRDAGIPLVMRYKTTSKGTRLPERWLLPDSLRDDTGVVFASAFPGYDSFAQIMAHYYADHGRHDQLALLESLRLRITEGNGHSLLVQEVDRRMDELRLAIERDPFVFDRRFLFRTLTMGHSQFAEFIGARGPNTAINAACASTTQAVALAQDWIQTGRCRRVIVVSADDITSDHLLDWMGAGFLATGAAATDDVVEEAATPFDRRRHGMIVGMGAAGLVIESAEAVRERGLQPICEVLSAVTANSAFHATRLDVQHISQVMEDLVAKAEARSGIQRREIAPRTVFVSHETYTPARGGSAAAEIHALRHVFGDAADRIVIANTKGFTGHAMAAGIEDVVAAKALETAVVPPVPNFKEVDPELGPLNLSRGGVYPVEYALRLGAGFGSQISMTLMRWVRTKDGSHRSPNALGYAYRIVDEGAWNRWLTLIAGHPAANLEVVRHTLRVRDEATSRLRVEESRRNASPIAKPLPAHAVAPATPAATVAETKSPQDQAMPKGDSRKTAAAVAIEVLSPAPPEQTGSVKERVLALVAEKTGYPIDMLDLDLDLEADLGIDTVKQAEVLATIREAYGIARDDKIKLRDFPTLAHVIRFVHERMPETEVKQTPQAVSPEKARESTPAEAQAAPAKEKEDVVKDRILALVVEKTGYPKDMLDLDLDLEADLGIDTVKQAEMFAAIREIYNIPRDENRKLRDYPTLSHVIRFVYEKRPDLAAAPSPTQPIAASPIAVPPPIAAQASTDVAVTDESIKEKVLDIVAAKTGYPKDMLDLDLDLEADLGIDTVKQAEMFAAVRAAYVIPREENLKLRDFPTLAHVIRFAQARRPGLSQVPVHATEGRAGSESKEPPAVATTPLSPQPGQVERPVPAGFEETQRIPRRVPMPALRPPLSICKPTAVTLGQGRRIVVMPDESAVGDALIKRLQGLGVEVLRIGDVSSEDALTAQLHRWVAAGPVHGVYWLPALDGEAPLDKMNLSSWHEALWKRLKALYVTMRTLYEQIAPADTFLVAATRLGGQHGYDEVGANAPLGGAVSGFTRAYKRERMDALVKVVDFEADRNPFELAAILVEETLRDPGAVEIGHRRDERWTVSLKEQAAAGDHPGMTLDKSTVFLITGAAGGIVSAITADLAAASGGTFYLLDLVPEPDPRDPDIKRFASDKEGLKRELFNRIQARGERATPALVERELASLERAHAALSAIETVKAAGGTVQYYSVDLTNADRVARIIQEVRDRSGHIDVLLHAAGLERSHLLPDKDPREFNLVFDVKADGWFNLLHAIGDMPLKTTIAFSSVAGRFGNAGQTDYSAANDLLCKMTSSLRRTRPATRGIVIDWTAWGGIGMATRGSIPKMMELAGIDMLPPEAGIPLIRLELTAGDKRGEIVVGQRLGILMKEWDVSGGVETTKADASNQRLAFAYGPMVGNVLNAGIHSGFITEAALDPAAQPFLHDHQIEGTPVLPGVMGIEAFAEAALCMLPGWSVDTIENVDFHAPFKFYRNEPRTVTTEVFVFSQAGCTVADCRLVGRRTLPNQTEPQTTLHFTGQAHLSRAAGEPAKTVAPGALAGVQVDAADIYRVYFHGPAYQVLERVWWDGHRIVGRMAKNLPSNHQPADRPTRIAPRLIELCFQTAGLWELGTQGKMGLPQHVDRIQLWRAQEPADGDLFAIVTQLTPHGSFEADVVDEKGNRYLSLSGYRTVPFPIESAALKKLQALMSLETVAA
jgi:acyl transferase domain-containing protein/NAD(P)-dependent dehydrogenase (short-subunit alcohol dehydrogenase family)/acyl carrier protein